MRAKGEKTMATSKLARPKCRCVATADRLLKPRHTQVDTNLFTGMVAVRTSLRHDAPKRTRPVTLIATFCPFCGVRYPGTDTTTKRELRKAP